MPDSDDVTRLLKQWRAGDEQALNELLPLVHEELQRLANRVFKGEASGHTLQPTALINEAYLKLADAAITWNDRTHFFALAARTMRRVLINHANARAAAKRGGDRLQVTLHDWHASHTDDEMILRLHDSLNDLAQEDQRKADVLELHYFGGLSYTEMANALGVSEATVKRDLRFAKAWVKAKLDI